MRSPIILSHGSDSGPDATKVSALAALAESLGWTTLRPDYREDDALGYAGSVPARLARLRAAIEAQPSLPVLPTEFMVGASRARLFSMLTTFGTPLDVTTDELRVESFFPADAQSDALLRALATSER